MGTKYLRMYVFYSLPIVKSADLYKQSVRNYLLTAIIESHILNMLKSKKMTLLSNNSLVKILC